MRAEAPAEAESQFNLTPYIEFAKRWWWLLVIGLALGLGASFVYMRYGPTPHISTALIQVQR